MSRNLLKEAISKNIIDKETILNNVLTNNSSDKYKENIIYIKEIDDTSILKNKVKFGAAARAKIRVASIACLLAIVSLTGIIFGGYMIINRNIEPIASGTNAIITPGAVNPNQRIKGNFIMYDNYDNIILDKNDIINAEIREDENKIGILITTSENGTRKLKDYSDRLIDENKNINEVTRLYIDDTEIPMSITNNDFLTLLNDGTFVINSEFFTSGYAQDLCDRINNGINNEKYESYKADIIEKISNEQFPDITNSFKGITYSFKEVNIEQIKENALIQKDVEATVLLFKITLSGNDTSEMFSVLAVDINGTLIYKIVCNMSVDTKFYLADIDRNGYNEIIVQDGTGGNGGFGSYEGRIFKFKDNNFIEIPMQESNADFYLSFSDGYNISVKNDYTNLNEELRYSEFNFEGCFDEMGKLTDKAKTPYMMVDSYFIFKPVDVDNDGIYELVTEQYCSYYFHANKIGIACCVWKFDNNENCMKLIKTGFWSENMVNDTSQGDPNKRWEYFSNHWYK